MERISGMSFDFYMMGFPIHVESVNLSISDNSAVALTRGIPDGWVSGDVAAEGEIDLIQKTFKNYHKRQLVQAVIAACQKWISRSSQCVAVCVTKWKPTAIKLF